MGFGADGLFSSYGFGFDDRPCAREGEELRDVQTEREQARQAERVEGDGSKV